MTYKPEPIDTSAISLPADLRKLADLLARNSHDIWVKERLDQGWVYGPQHDPIRRINPYLVSFADLPDSEQQSRRITVSETLKTMMALNYSIETSDSAGLAAALEDSDLNLIVQGLKSASDLSLSSLLDLRRETVRLQPRSPEIYRVLGDSILQLGEPLMAYDVLAEGLKYWPEDLRLQQLLALALARSGSTVAANSLLQTLVQGGQSDNETLGLLARTHKDLWLQATDVNVRRQQLQQAYACYQQAYAQSQSVWTGINAATMAMVMGQTDEAKALAQAVRDRCLVSLPPPAKRSSADYWNLATLGEVALLLGEWTEAEDCYRQAVAVGQGRFGDLSSTRRNAMLLTQYLGGDLDTIKRWFQIPRVVVFCGHRIDHPSRPHPRFPAELEPAVYAAIRDRLLKLDARLGYSSAACGSDILFLEAIRELNGEMHVVLPYGREQFVRDSVATIPGSEWGDRFERVMQQATEVIVASHLKLQENDVVYEYSNRLLHGLAKMRAEQLGTDLVPMSVWDGKPGDGPGGTASTVAHWQQWTDNIEIIHLDTLLTQTPIALPSPRPPLPIVTLAGDRPTLGDTAAATAGEGDTMAVERQIRALLFADVVHYSQLGEDQYLPFVQHFLGAIADLAGQPIYYPLLKNTWGDALYFVFANVNQAGRFALDLCDLVQSIDWSTRSLPKELNLRVALHAGPVEQNIDPITGHLNYVGAHVNHTARIEPITPPGKVYASQAFAAIASSEGLKDFTCDYVGQMPWAKRYGTFPTYHVHRCIP
ncbi:MAG TPA: TRAFs-binding domain-containing protein [Chroococcidiopsis sp.]